MKFNNKSTFDGVLFKKDVPAEITCRVLKSGVTLKVNGRTVVDWKGDFSRLSPAALLTRLQIKNVRLFINGGRTRYSKYELQPLKSVEPAVIDLLKRVNPSRDVIRGKWTFKNGALLSGDGASFFRITEDVPKAYELQLTVTRTGTIKQAHAFQMYLFGGGRRFSATLDGSGAWFSGLQLIDGKPYTENESAWKAGDVPLLKIGTESQIVCRVDGSGVKVTVDGKSIIDWDDFSRLSSHPKPIFDSLADDFDVSRFVDIARSAGWPKSVVP